MKSFLTGLATGLAIGYLTAPRSGKETLDQLAEAVSGKTKGLQNQWDKTQAQVNDFADDVKSQAGVAKSEANVFADKAADKLNEYKDEVRHKATQAKNQYNTNVDQAADASKEGLDNAHDTLKLVPTLNDYNAYDRPIRPVE